ncbi:hypothetical protein WN51_14515 [Melipona quadrifasciata]|uniref:Uncharacterized protein n=1 Tax=Melipona quadrifasciata TaxID=166423 RepID=A0A0M9A0R7_9HYME|nr:hypothetical protein WN51_14515 [Melipona quadrifasciata]
MDGPSSLAAVVATTSVWVAGSSHFTEIENDIENSCSNNVLQINRESNYEDRAQVLSPTSAFLATLTERNGLPMGFSLNLKEKRKGPVEELSQEGPNCLNNGMEKLV